MLFCLLCTSPQTIHTTTDADISVLITTKKQFTSDSESVVSRQVCTSPRTIPTTTYDAAICVLINSDHKSPQKRVSIPWMMFDAEFVVTELLSFAINIAFAFMLFCCTYSTHCAVDKG